MTADDPLIVDDVVLLLMDDDGASVQGPSTLHDTPGGALLTEVALLGRVEIDDTGIVDGPRVTPAGTGPLRDPRLQSAHDTVTGEPPRVQLLLPALGGEPWRVVPDRLVDRGLRRREERRVLGVVRSTRWPADDERHEAQLRVRIHRVLRGGEEPDPRTAAGIGLTSTSGAMPSLRPPSPWTAPRPRPGDRAMTGPEPASVTASRQLAADSRDPERQVRGRPREVPPGRRAPGGTGAGTTGGRTIRPLGRPSAEHLEMSASVDAPGTDEWRLRRLSRVRAAGRDDARPDES